LIDSLTRAQSRGSPSYQYGLSPTNFITAVNGVETHDLDGFVREVDQIPDNTYFRLRAVTFDNVPWVVTMKKNDHYVGFSYSLVLSFPFPPSLSFLSFSLPPQFGTYFKVLTRSSQFPMSEYVKDPSSPEGWRMVSYEKGQQKYGGVADTTYLNADSMDEGAGGGNTDMECDALA
jgi:pro-apoptotic serine protease NMA111